MLMSIYKKAFAVLARKPLKLWGISLLSIVITSVLSVLFGATIGIALALNLLISTSMVMVYLHGYKGEDVKVVQLFDCFKDFATIKRVVCGMAWMALWIFLWGLIPIVGWIFVIIKSYAYRLTPYILVHEQNIPLTEAIKVSEQRTKGFKGKMFLADFVPYIFIFVAFLFLGVLSSIRFIGGLFALLTVLLALCVAAFTPLFFGLVQAAFYVEIENIRKSGFNPYAQPTYVPQNPYAQQQNPYNNVPRAPYGAPGQTPYGQPQQNPFAQPQHPPYHAPQQPTQNPDNQQ